MAHLVGDDPAVLQAQDALTAAGDALVMGDDDEGASPPGRRREQDGHHLDGSGRVEGSGGLVGEDDRRVDDLGSGDGHSLRLAAGELTDASFLHASQSHRAQPLDGVPDGLGPRGAIEHERQGGVLDGGELGDEHSLLEDEPEGLATQLGPSLAGETLDVDDAVGQTQLDAAGVGREDPGQAVQQGGLSRSGRPHDGDRLAGRDGDVDVVEGTSRPVGLRQSQGAEVSAGDRFGDGVRVGSGWRQHVIHRAARAPRRTSCWRTNWRVLL